MSAYAHATAIIEKNREAVRLMAEALLEQESLEAHEIQEILTTAHAVL